MQRADDRLISLISRWLTRKMGNDELRGKLAKSARDELEPPQAEAVRELIDELEAAEPTRRGHVEMVARETIEVLAVGE
jgi:hypothetical protein